MDPFYIILIILPFLIIPIICIFLFDRKLVIKRKIRKTPGKNISEVQNGEVVKIKGQVVYFGETLIAPLSGRKCSYYHIIVRKQQGKSSIILIDEEKAGDLVIQNGKHFASISTSIAKTYINKDKTFQSGFLQNASPRLNNFLQERGETSENFLGLNKSLYYEEGILEKGEVVAVAGKAKWINKNEFYFDIPCERVLLIEAENKENPVYFSDAATIVYTP